jgi:GTP:adenosylcobinamide-phosphate guanylyltransferase
LLAYNTVFIISAYAFNEFITRIYRNKKWHEEIDLNVNNDIEYNSMIDFNNSDAELNINLPNDLKTVEDQLDEDEKDENTPLIT